MHALLFLLALTATQQPLATQPAARLQVFLDCSGECFADYLREEIGFAAFVRDRNDADVHVIITSTTTGSGGREYNVALMGARAYAGREVTLKAVTGTGDPEEIRRRQLLTTLRVGLLQYVAKDGVPQNLSVDVELSESPAAAGVRRDRWNKWVFSIEGSADFNGEESNKERQVSAELSADRITPDWKMTF